MSIVHSRGTFSTGPNSDVCRRARFGDGRRRDAGAFRGSLLHPLLSPPTTTDTDTDTTPCHPPHPPLPLPTRGLRPAAVDQLWSSRVSLLRPRAIHVGRYACLRHDAAKFTSLFLHVIGRSAFIFGGGGEGGVCGAGGCVILPPGGREAQQSNAMASYLSAAHSPQCERIIHGLSANDSTEPPHGASEAAAALNRV